MYSGNFRLYFHERITIRFISILSIVHVGNKLWMIIIVHVGNKLWMTAISTCNGIACSAVYHTSYGVCAFLVRDSMLSALYAIARPSVCLSICPSVCHTGGSVKNGLS